MLTIWKHQLGTPVRWHSRDARVGWTVQLPAGARILHFDDQPRVGLCLWEAHDPQELRTELRSFQLVGTGHLADVDPARHIGTILVADGEFVWHLFEVTPEATP